MDEKEFQKMIDKIRQEITDLQTKFNSDINKIFINLNMFKMIEEKPVWPTNEDFHQLQDFNLEEIINIKTNLLKSSKLTNYKYSCVAKFCGYVDLPEGWYKCESNWFSNNHRGICIKYGELIAPVSSCQPMNNTKHIDLNKVLTYPLIARVSKEEYSNNMNCYLYPKELIYK